MGLLFSNVARGIGVGFAAGAVYLIARKGREVELPAETGLLTRPLAQPLANLRSPVPLNDQHPPLNRRPSLSPVAQRFLAVLYSASSASLRTLR
jgi:hypothetical protein